MLKKLDAFDRALVVLAVVAALALIARLHGWHLLTEL
jgi:hypothetical protein